jgi:hypothetical protein
VITFVRRVQNLERRHDLPCGHRLDLELAACEFFHGRGEHAEVVLQGQARRPGGLHLERPWSRLLSGGGQDQYEGARDCSER